MHVSRRVPLPSSFLFLSRSVSIPFSRLARSLRRSSLTLVSPPDPRPVHRYRTRHPRNTDALPSQWPTRASSFRARPLPTRATTPSTTRIPAPMARQSSLNPSSPCSPASSPLSMVGRRRRRRASGTRGSAGAAALAAAASWRAVCRAFVRDARAPVFLLAGATGHDGVSE